MAKNKELEYAKLVDSHIKYSFFKKPLKKYVPLSVPITYFFISAILLALPAFFTTSVDGFYSDNQSAMQVLKDKSNIIE